LADLTALTLELQNALRDYPAGRWVALAPGSPDVVAEAADPAAVLTSARNSGHSDPFIIKVPDALPPLDTRYKPDDVVPTPGIFDAWKSGRVVPFLGAGASIAGGLPTVATLIEVLARKAQFPLSGFWDLDLAKVSSFYEMRIGRPALYDELRGMLAASQRAVPGPLHRFIASDTGRSAKLIMTTNYDTLIEQALAARGVPFDLLVYPTDATGENANAALWIPHGGRPEYKAANTLAIGFEHTVVYKMHGSLGAAAEWDSFVITEDDYMEFLARMIARTAIPTAILDYLPKRQLLFLGYGLRDWNLRVVLQNLNTVLTAGNRRRPPSWAIQRRPSPVECALWLTRNIQIFDQALDEFASELLKLAGES
jgi:NAD-dependent SIR2 family protein deacetylase